LGGKLQLLAEMREEDGKTEYRIQETPDRSNLAVLTMSSTVPPVSGQQQVERQIKRWLLGFRILFCFLYSVSSCNS
jgi:hypothetical protein